MGRRASLAFVLGGASWLIASSPAPAEVDLLTRHTGAYARALDRRVADWPFSATHTHTTRLTLQPLCPVLPQPDDYSDLP